MGLCAHSSVWKVSSANRGECVTTGCLYRPTHLCVAHFELPKKVTDSFFLWCGKVGGGGVPCFREGWGDLSSGLSQPEGKSCWAVWRSGLWCSGTVFLMAGAGRDCGKDGWGPARYIYRKAHNYSMKTTKGSSYSWKYQLFQEKSSPISIGEPQNHISYIKVFVLFSQSHACHVLWM